MRAKLFPVCLVMVLFWDGNQARSAGREFATAFIQNYLAAHEQPLFQLYISSLNSDCQLKVSVSGLHFTHEAQLAAGQGITVTLPKEVELFGSKKSRNTAFIQATADVIVTSLNSKRYTADTSLVYPMSEWGTEYFVFTPSNSPPSMLKEFVLVNGKDQNTVEVFLRAAVRFEGRLYGVGSKLVVAMEPFENVQLQSQGDLTGTRVSSQSPVAVISGHMCTWRFSKCNHVYEQLLPVQNWGTHFLVAPLNIQSQFDTVYIQASQSTNITVQSGRSSSAEILQRGLILEYKVQFPDGLNITADKGIQVLFVFNGVRTSQGPIYDPFMINLLPNNRFCSSYALEGVDGFDNRALLIVPTKEQTGINFDSLPLPRNTQWRVIKGSEYSWTEITYQTGEGRHSVTHPSAFFGVYSVGLEQVNGYGSAAPCIDPELVERTSRSCFDINCSLDKECLMKGLYPTCVKKPFGTCWAMGDPHYYTFDRRYFDFMGTCTYIITKSCQTNDSVPAFEVLAKNENRGNTRVSYVAGVTVNVGGVTISVKSSEPGKVRIDQSLWSLPVVLNGVGVSIFQSGRFITIRFSFGLSVEYDWNHYLMINLPSTFLNKVCGLCGNFNGDPNDDLAMPSSSQAPNVTEFGRSWKVPNLALDEDCSDDCGDHCHGCEPQAHSQWQGEDYCGLLNKEPFSQCHSVIDPSIYIQNCLYDICMADGYRYYLCKAIEVYADFCQRVGIQLTNWREAANCPYRCPENSHYEFCGTACPLTCIGLSFPLNCTLPCVETCICDPGFVLSGTKCVPIAQCGCSYNGRYVPAGESFWADDACQRLCRCSSEGGHLECAEVGCRAGQHCQVVNGIRDCYPISQSTCMALGDPHYTTFDGKTFDFQGNCMYQLVGVCTTDPGLVPFDILVQNDFRGNTVASFTKLLEIKVHNISIVIDKDYAGYITVNDELLNLPLNLIDGQVSVFKSGWSAVIQTTFGLKVSFDWNSIATVTLPSTYMGAVCGLCGNYNGNPEDDLMLKEKSLSASGPVEFGTSWRVAEIPGCVHSCTGICPDCDPINKRLYETSEFCRVLRDPQGPFANCHTMLDPVRFFENCVYDVCLYNGRRDVLCQAITAYVSACQTVGITISPWRTAQFCGVQCPIHSHYELCSSGCEVTCHSLAPPTGCHSSCKEGCVCDEGYVLSGRLCVPLSQCGCLYDNRYYSFNQVFYPDTTCEKECRCMQDGQVNCNKLSCGPRETCELVNGVRRCQPIGQAVCDASGDPHYMSFDGLRFDFQGTCTYILSQACGIESTNLSPFSIQVKNEKWPNKYSKVSVTKEVALIIYGNTIVLRQRMSQILVNGVLTNVPYSSSSVNGTLVQVYQEGNSYIIKTDFGLWVTYDLFYHVTVTIPGNYRNKTCGICGNFDGIPFNDFQLPGGNITQDVNIFGRAWKVDVPGVMCEDGCERDTCLACDPQLKAIFEQRPYCGVLIDPMGPFASCHSVINPSAYLNNCVFDTCVSSRREVVCESVATYALSCQTAGVVIGRWRTDSFCSMSCPANSHYELCADVCSAACPGLTAVVQCRKTCREGCTCDLGYLFDGQQCVQHQQCGCYEEGHTYKAGEVVYLNQCQKKCECDPGWGLTCESHTCANGTHCLLKDGVMACYHQDPCEDILCREKETCHIEQGKAMCVPLYYATCWDWGETHYHTFDGYDYDFQGTCKYILSKTCGNLNGLVPFSITQTNENHDNLSTSYVREVEVIIYGITLTMIKYQPGQIMVDGIVLHLPLDLHDGRVRVHQIGNAVVLITDFGLRILYDGASWVYLLLPSSYYGVLCGLCGNFNGNYGDELSDPAGQPLPSVYQWAKSWKTQDSGVITKCYNGCETNCPVCTSDQQALYQTQALCGAMTSDQNVFMACHAKVNPKAFQHSCVYDLCFSDGDQRLLCQALESYVNLCRQEGVVITDWRREFNCSMDCPPNSHYEACASACPVTCLFPDQQSLCLDTCVEACVCDNGFALSAGTCVPTNECGCYFQGSYYQQGQSFWVDEGCHQLCECDRNLSIVVCRESSCGPGETCSVVDGRRSCQSTSTAVCVASTDPHYRTFDGHHFDFQGTCVYQLAALCVDKEGLVPFNVTVQNEHRGNTAVSFTKTVNVSVNGFTITMTREHPNQILVDGQLAHLPLSIKDTFVVYISGNSAVLKTHFGLQVTFNWRSVASITVPHTYSGAVCGLCGNFNGAIEDDFLMHNGVIAPNASSFGQSWQVATVPDCSSAGCYGNECPTCSSIQRQNALQHCNIITNQTGPFRECHGRIDPWSYLEDCAFDTCQFQGHQSVLCDAVADYVYACQREGVTIHPWRSPTYCPLTCPPNSHYNPCAPGCTETCGNIFPEHSCDRPCVEACQCDHGYVLSGQTCVPLAECGCIYQGRYYKKHQEFYNHEQCLELCRCGENGTVSCQASGCGPEEACSVVGGVLGCHPTNHGRCMASGDPHYMSFDGRWFDFQGTCIYTLAKVCDQGRGRLRYFSVDTQNESFGNRGVSVIKNLTVTVYTWTIGLRRGENWRVTVNNEFVNLPVSLDNHVMISQVGFSIMVQTDFGLRVLYDTSYHAEVHVPSSYQGSMCGLCGNYNNNPADDFLLPNGTQSTSIDAFGQAWAVSPSGVQCGGCEGYCQQCDQTKTDVYHGTDACGLMAATTGPFSACHDRVNPWPHVNNCAFDMCVMDGDEATLCQNLQAYAIICQQAGIQNMPWRNDSFCSPQCPENSHYTQCSNNCANTCASLTLAQSIGNCPEFCIEGCDCDDGLVSDGDQCVSVRVCGCAYNGKYLKVGEVSVTDSCDVKCTCHAGGVLECVKQTCSRSEICGIQNGTRACYPDRNHCVFDTGDQLHSFDGVGGPVMRPGAFQMAFLCDQESPDWFRVVLDVQGCSSSDSVNVMVHVFLHGMIITVNNHLHSWVNGRNVSYPIMPQEGLLVWYRNETVFVERRDMRVTYSLTEGVVLTVSRELTGNVCGACGNFNGDALDDMTTSDGRNVTAMSQVVSSWQAEDFFTCG